MTAVQYFSIKVHICNYCGRSGQGLKVLRQFCCLSIFEWPPEKCHSLLGGQACHTVNLITELDKTNKSHRIKKNYVLEVIQQRASQTSSTIFTVGQKNSTIENSTTR